MLIPDKVRYSFFIINLILWFDDKKEKFWMAVAWGLPRKLVYWAAIRLYSHASGDHAFPFTPVYDIDISKALKAWDDCPLCNKKTK